MKQRSDYRIVKYQFDIRPIFEYRVDQKFLWFLWKTPDVDNILAHSVVWSSENYRRAKTFSSQEDAEDAIKKSLEYRKATSWEQVVG